MDENRKRLNRKLDRMYVVVFIASIITPWGQLTIDQTARDIVLIIFGDDSIVPPLFVIALLPLCIAAVLLSVRFKQRRNFFALFQIIHS